MMIAIGGAIRWGENKERFRERCAWKVNYFSPFVEFTMRRVRSILSNEKIKLDADEYLAIERAYVRANQALETVQHLARDADLRADRAGGREPGGREASGGQADPGQLDPAGRTAVRPAR